MKRYLFGILLLAALAFFISTARAAITLDSTNVGTFATGFNTSSTATTHKVTNGLTNVVTIAALYDGNNATATQVMYNGVAMTKVCEREETLINDHYVALYIATSTGDGLSHNASATFSVSGGSSVSLQLYSFSGVDQTTMFRASSVTSTQFDNLATGTVSFAVPAQSGDTVLDVFGSTVGNVTSTQTLITSQVNMNGNAETMAESYAGNVSGQTTMGYQLPGGEHIGAMCGFALIPASTVPPPPKMSFVWWGDVSD